MNDQTTKPAASMDLKAILPYLAFIIQTGAFAFWLGGLTAQVESNTLELRDKKQDGNRIAVIETKIDSMQKSLVELNALLKELSQARRGQ